MARFIVNPNGTVPVRFNKFYGGYGSGEIAGFDQATSVRLVDEMKVASFVNPDGSAVVEAEPEAAPEDQLPPPVPDNGADVEIPADWRDKHHLSRMALAAKISGAQVPNDETAIAVIEAELARRSGAA